MASGDIDSSAHGDPSADRLNPGRLLFELAGAAAGIVVFVTLVGGLIWRARLSALQLPADSTVVLLPRETIVLAGVRLILPSVVVGAALLLSLSLLGSSTMAQGWLTPLRRVALGVVASAPIVFVTGYHV